MLFWRQIAHLFRKLQTMADEPISQQSIPFESMESANSPGIASEPEDVDNTPIGRCYPEVLKVQQLVKQLREIHAALGDAVAALGDCRAAVRMAGATADADAMSGVVTSLGHVIDTFALELSDVTDCPACKKPEEPKAE